KLTAARILRSVSSRNGEAGSHYEIYHDVLAQPVLVWKSAHETQRELVRQKAEADRRHRRLRGFVIEAGVGVAAMAGVTIFALTQRSEARSQAALAHARELAASATAQLDVDPQRSLALAVEAASIRREPAVEDVLRRSLVESKELAVLPSGGPVRSVHMSSDGRFVVTASDDRTARSWPRSGGSPEVPPHPRPGAPA